MGSSSSRLQLRQVQDFNVNGRFSSLKHETCLMNQREKFYQNYYTDDYQLNFREFFDEGLFGFQIEIFSNFLFYFFLFVWKSRPANIVKWKIGRKFFIQTKNRKKS